MTYRNASRNAAVKEMMQDLLNVDVISRSKIASMKTDQMTIIDPNLIMDLRHKVVKRSFARHREACDGESSERKSTTPPRKDKPDINEFFTVEKEIQSFKTHLEKERRKLEASIVKSFTDPVREVRPKKVKKAGKVEEIPVIITVETTPKRKIKDGEGNEKAKNTRKAVPEVKERNRVKNKLPVKDLTLKKLEEEEGGTGSEVMMESPRELNVKDIRESVTVQTFVTEAKEELKPRLGETVEEEVEISEEEIKTVLSFYMKQWKRFAERVKEEREEEEKAEGRQRKMDRFVELLERVIENKKRSDSKVRKKREEEKKGGNKRAVSCFENRFKAQGETIARQRSILTEQRTVIENLQKEQEELQARVRQNLKSLRERLSGGGVEIRGALRGLEILNPPGEEGRGPPKTSAIVRRMKEREEEWRRRREEGKRRREEAEEGRRREEEEGRRRREREEREERARLEKEKKEREREAQVEKQRERLYTEMARAHHRKKLMARVFARLKRLLTEAQAKTVRADTFYKTKLRARALARWQAFTQDSIDAKMLLAKQFSDKSLLRKCLSGWLSHYKDHVSKCRLADEIYNKNIVRKSFSNWKKFLEQCKLRYEKQCCIADEHYQRKLLSNCLFRWKSFPQVMFEEREREKRLRKWKDKVREILPDFI